MNKKYIESSILLTKEAFAEYISKQREAEAASYGLTLEQYQQAILSGSCVQSSPPTGH
jgi:hypothetical protein